MYEREFSPETAKKKILEAAHSIHLSVLTDHLNASSTVATCTLLDKYDAVVAEGAGKGAYAEIGAVAESLEHFAATHYGSDDLIGVSIDQIRRQSCLSMEGLIASLPETQLSIDCARLLESRSGLSVMVPAILHLPNSPLEEKLRACEGISFLSRYSSNSGIAFGCSENEATLHGINELIERHILSKILMALCGQHESLLLVAPDTHVLEEILAEHPELRSFAKDMKILFTKTIYGVYFCIAIPKRPVGRHPMCPIGSGCSVDPRIAIQRATTELFQCMLLFDESEKEVDLRAHALLQRSERFRPLISLEMLRNIDQICGRLAPPTKLSVEDQIDLITDKISSTGLRILHRTLLNFDNGCAVVQIYIPGMERFNLIRAGVPVVPQHLLHANKHFT